jgi:hypothetical protein
MTRFPAVTAALLVNETLAALETVPPVPMSVGVPIATRGP